MLKHAVKMLASGEYACKCGLVWDKDEGDECPARKLTIDRLNRPEVDNKYAGPFPVNAPADSMELPITFPAGTIRLQIDRELREAEAKDAPYISGDTEPTDAWAAGWNAYHEKLIGLLATGCTFCGSNEHMTAVCPMRVAEPVYQFQYREIGEGGWSACGQEWYTHCQKSPEHDARVVQVVAPGAGRACQHRFMFFGSQEKRRCADCGSVEAAKP